MKTVRPPALREAQRVAAAALRRSGETLHAIGKKLGVPVSTLARWAAEDGWRLADIVQERHEGDPPPAPAAPAPPASPGSPDGPHVTEFEGFDDDAPEDADPAAARRMLARAAKLEARGDTVQAERVARLAERMLRVSAQMGGGKSDELPFGQRPMRGPNGERLSSAPPAGPPDDDPRSDAEVVLEMVGRQWGGMIDRFLAGEYAADLPFWAARMIENGVSFAYALRLMATPPNDPVWKEIIEGDSPLVRTAPWGQQGPNGEEDYVISEYHRQREERRAESQRMYERYKATRSPDAGGDEDDGGEDGPGGARVRGL